MSSQRGNVEKKKAPKYANKTAFRNNLHDTNKRTKAIRELEVTGCCEKCTKVIEWKIKYKKYKPLTQPKRCVKCQEKAVLNAYNIICMPCATELQVCSKCSEKLPSNPVKIETETRIAIDTSELATVNSGTALVNQSELNNKLDVSPTEIERLGISNRANALDSEDSDVESDDSDGCDESDDSEDSSTVNV